jgi:hypothetical protein
VSGRTRELAASAAYLALFVPPGVFFAGDGLPQPWFTIVGTLIMGGSVAVGWVVAKAWAVALPLAPWVAALVVIAVADDEDFGEVTRRGSMILWSVVFAFLIVLVAAGILARRTSAR